MVHLSQMFQRSKTKKVEEPQEPPPAMAKEPEIHLRDTVEIIRVDEDGTEYGYNAFGPCKVFSNGGIIPCRMDELYPGLDLGPAMQDISCFSSRWGDCQGRIADCSTLSPAVVCEHHHNEVHGGRGGYPINKGRFMCRPLESR